MLAKITDERFGGTKLAATADLTGLAEGASFRLVSMTLPFYRAQLHEEAGVQCVTGYTVDGKRKVTARLAEVIAL
jgi:hypothetical protein